ncbi:hypothetical protein [Nisaea sp.]|uniref:hypothetical protein n=1 Tax=Nisaea sp. TaxID=2024842 RepID=UPI00329A2FD0
MEDKKGCEHCLIILEPMASRAPAVRLALALDHASAGDRKGAARHLDLFFSRTHERLHESRPDLLRDSGFVGFLIFHLLRGHVDEVLDYMERSQDLELAHPVVDLELFKVRHVASAVRQYRECPIAWKSEKRLLVSVLVWGEEFSDIWLKYGLSSLLSEENKRLWDSRETVFQFVSTPETLNYLRRQPMFAKLEALYRISLIDITPVLTAGISHTNYIAMLIAQWVPMCIGATENADCISLGADSFFSKAAFSYIAQRLEEDKTDVFYTLDYPISASAVPEIESWRGSDGVLDIPEHELGQFFLENMSSRVEPYCIDPADSTMPSDPSRVYSRLQHGVLMRSLQPQLIYVCSNMLKNLWVPRLSATDNGFADAALAVLGDFERMEMLVQPDLFGCSVIEGAEEDRIASGQIPSRVPVKETIANDLLNLIRGAGLLSPARVWSFRQPMLVLGDGEVTSAGTLLIDQLAAQLPDQGRYGPPDMMAEHGGQAFERFRRSGDVPK